MPAGACCSSSHFILPRRSIKREIRDMKGSGNNDPQGGPVATTPKTKESIWQKATSLRQSLRHTSRSKVGQKASGVLEPSAFPPKGPCSKTLSLKREWGSQKNLARERKSLAVAPKTISEASKRSVHARSLCVVSGSEWDFDMMVQSTPEGIDQADSAYQIELPRHLRSSRKLTKDSGYETSAQGDPDYINTLSDWLSEENALDKVGQSISERKSQNGDVGQVAAEKRLEWTPRPRPLSFSHQDVPAERKNRHLRLSYSQREAGPAYENHRLRQPSVESLRYLKPESRYSSVESVANSGHLAKSTPHLANLKKAAPSYCNLRPGDSKETMVTRRFKKGSVYDTLASTSGLDFSPVIQSKAYSPRREDVSNSPGSCKMSGRSWDDAAARSPAAELPKEGQTEKNNSPMIAEVPRPTFSPEIEGRKSSPRESKFQQPVPQVPVSSSANNYGCVTSHEKYPSWPVTNVCSPSASFRSHSWIPQTDYPKEKVGYMRPKKSFKISSNQLQPVLEKSPDSNVKKTLENSPPPQGIQTSSLDSNHSLSATCAMTPNTCNNNKPFDFEAFHTPCIPQCYGEKDYSIHSPPERDTSSIANGDAVSSESNRFLSKYEDVIRHQAQYSVPLSMWNKGDASEDKDNSSVDTPFLDRLRLDNARAWPPPPPPPPPNALLLAPPQNDIELSSENGTWMGSMESSSHGRGLPKWQGSYSDLSTLSTQLSNRSSLFDSGHSTMPESGRLSPQSSCGSTAPSLLLEGPTRAQVVARHGCHREIVAHSARVQQPERHGSESVLYYANGAPNRPKTAMSFNVEEHDRMKSPEPVPGPSGIRYNLSPEEGTVHRSQAVLHVNSAMSNCKPQEPLPTDRHVTKSRSSNSFSSEDSSFRAKDINEDTSGSSSDVSNITCISNYRESLASSQSSTLQSTHSSSALASRSSKPQSKSTSSTEELSKLQSSSFTRQPSPSDSSESFSASTFNKLQATPSRAGANFQSSRGQPGEPGLRHRNSGEGKSRSMDGASRKALFGDLEKRQRISEPDLKTIQKQAVFSFYQRMSLAESVRGSTNYDCSKTPSESSASYELPSPTRLKMPNPKLSILPNKYTVQDFDDKKDDVFNPVSRNDRPESSKNCSQTSSLNLSKSVPNLLSLKNQTLDVPISKGNSSPQQTYWAAGGGQQTGKRGSPLAKEEIIPWDQLPNVLERKREAVGRVLAGKNDKAVPAATENKEPPEDGSGSSTASATNYFKGHKSPRKVQLKEVHHSNEPASVKVITRDGGVTLVQTTGEKGRGHQHHKRRPAPPPPPKQPPKRPPPPPPPESPPPPQHSPVVVIVEDHRVSNGDVDKELRDLRLEDRRPECEGAPATPDGECCSSPDLPLPPPPSSPGEEEASNEPLPPPPDEVELTNRTLDSSLVYPKNSYMSYRSEKKLGRQGFEGNYRRSFHTSSSSMDLSSSGQDGPKDHPLSPSSWEAMHNIRQHGTTVIFHSKVRRSSSQELPSPPASQESPCADSSVVIACDASLSSLENCLLTDDSFVDSLESDCSSLISVDHNQNALVESSFETTPGNINNELVIRTNSSTQTSDMPRMKRKSSKTKEELECERLSLDFFHRYEDARLRNLLVPAENQKSMADYMQGLVNLELENGGPPLERLPTQDKEKNGHWDEASEKLSNSPDSIVAATNHYRDMENRNLNEEQELMRLQEELMVSIRKKVEVMRKEQVLIREEMQRNEKLGKELANRVQKLAKPNEAEKYSLHVEETEKILHLLLSLSGRLAKAENMIRCIPNDASPDEKRLLEAKRSKLLEQHEDARRLKESIDRRSNQISTFLQRYLSEQEYADYDFFIKMKTRLIVDGREIDEKISLGEEQLAALRHNVDSQLWKSANS